MAATSGSPHQQTPLGRGTDPFGAGSRWLCLGYGTMLQNVMALVSEGSTYAAMHEPKKQSPSKNPDTDSICVALFESLVLWGYSPPSVGERLNDNVCLVPGDFLSVG